MSVARVLANEDEEERQNGGSSPAHVPLAFWSWWTLGLLVVALVPRVIYVFGISCVFFVLYKRFFALRVSPETELKGLDLPEMGSLGYNPDAEFYEPPISLATEGVSISGGGGGE